MNKFLILLFFLFSLNFTQAQDSLVKAKESTSIKWEEKDILVDSETIVKKAFPKNFKKKYTDSDFIYERQPVDPTLWQRFLSWLLSKIVALLRLSNPKTAFTIIKIIAGLVILLVVYLIAKAFINKEGSWIFSDNGKKKIDYQDIEKNIHLIDFEKLIQECLAQGKNRLCIRYYYLWLLKVMTENNCIEWHVDKTNSDYLYELQSKPLREEFTYLSYLYNYIWYGEFEMDEKNFLSAQRRFKNALKSFDNE